MLISHTVLMIEPIRFGFNESASATNHFQKRVNTSPKEIQQKALKEFTLFVDLLRSNGINVIVFKDLIEPHTPDSIFPNNWFSTSPHDRFLITYPMANENRAVERRKDIIDHLLKKYDYLLDQSLLEFDF